MSEENTENETPTNEGEETPEETPEETTEEAPKLSEEEVAELKKRAELAENYKIRAEKAEKELKKPKPEELKPPEGLSPKDYLTLTERGVSAEDYDEVVRVAKILNKPIFEALDDKTMRAILNERVEERKTANATQTKSGRGSVKTSGEDFLRKAEETGEIPENPADQIKMEEARIARLKKERGLA